MYFKRNVRNTGHLTISDAFSDLTVELWRKPLSYIVKPIEGLRMYNENVHVFHNRCTFKQS